MLEILCKSKNLFSYLQVFSRKTRGNALKTPAFYDFHIEMHKYKSRL